MKKTMMNNEEIKKLIEKAGNQNILHNKKEYVPYSILTNRNPDFKVKYTLINHEKKLFVGMRSNFKYVDELDKIWLIYPEFLDENNKVITDEQTLISSSGKAYMWILNDRNRDIHKNKIVLGTMGYITFGNDILAKVIVIKVFF